MRYPLQNIRVVEDGQFGTDPKVYAQFNLAGHNGVDFIASVGLPIYAPEDATVVVSSNGTTDQYTGAGVAGEVVVLRGTSEHWLLHLSKRNVSKGDTVKEGQLIGYSGNTGFTTGPHLHWGVRPLQPNIKNGYRGFIDPMEFMKNQGENMAVKDRQVRLLLFAILGLDGQGVGDRRLNALDYKDPKVTKIVQSYIDGGKTTAELLDEFWESDQGKAYRDQEIPQVYALATKTKQIKDLLK